MAETVTVLVGDRFEEFAQNPGVATVSEFLAATGTADGEAAAFVVGQGLSRDAKAALIAAHANDVHADLLVEPAIFTHKRHPKNVMISIPRRVDYQVYEADLALDDSNEVMEDHQTGQHIQGLALIEAARQMWTAVTERFILEGARPTRFVIDNVRAKFEGFVFPLPSTLRLTVLDSAVRPMQRRLSVRVEVQQAAQTTTIIEADFRVIDERISARQESVAALRALDAVVGGKAMPIERAAI